MDCIIFTSPLFRWTWYDSEHGRYMFHFYVAADNKKKSGNRWKKMQGMHWIPFDQDSHETLVPAFVQFMTVPSPENNSVCYCIEGVQYFIDFNRQTQTNQVTNTVRPILIVATLVPGLMSRD